MMENTQDNKIVNENEIDIIELIKRLWSKRRFVTIITLVFMGVGLFVALFSPKEFSADCVIVPQISQKGGGGSLSSLAAMAGINIGDMSGTEALSPKIYPTILKNVNFQKELMYTKIKFERWDEPVTLYDYYTDKKYATFNLFSFIKRYTIGLPGVIRQAIFGKEEDKEPVISGSGYGLLSMTMKEAQCAQILSNKISITINDKDGYITLSATMPEAMASAQVAEGVFSLLQKYLTEFKIEKAKSNFDYVKGRYEEAKREYEAKQIEYAEYQDANRMLNSKVAAVKEEQLKGEYNLANTLYNELSKQLLQANLKVKEDTPILTQVKPIVVPDKKSKPNRPMILVMFTFLGAILGCGAVFGLDFLKKNNIENKYL